LLERGFFDARAVWFLCPLLNPVGLAHGTRENAGGLDLNRDYLHPASTEVRAHTAWLQRQPRFDLALILHEDWRVIWTSFSHGMRRNGLFSVVEQYAA
jgi:murein tripeptide amidase MpaA